MSEVARRAWPERGRVLPWLGIVLLCGCASRGMMLDLRGAVMYEKPRIAEIVYDTADERRSGGSFVIEVTLVGDPGLVATFDVTPDLATREPMQEAEAGRYVGRFVCPAGLTGGPFTVVGRLWHERAGEVTTQDSRPLIIGLSR